MPQHRLLERAVDIAKTAALTAAAAVAATAASAAVAADCTDLAGLALPGVEIVAAAAVAPGAFEPPGGGFARFGGQAYQALPAFCRVEAVARPAAGSAIGIEVWLPAAGWNGKLLGVGNGGWAGSIGHAALAGALADGYAAASTDTGHAGGSPDFALEHPDKLIDFAHRAVHEMTVVGKAVTTAFYERTAERAYFSGCSTGGRQALAAAQRYPGDYDGIVAGAPAYYPSHIQGMQVWTNAVAERSEAARLDVDDFRLVNEAAIAACDLIDGVADGVIEDPRACGFDPGVLACATDGDAACLGPEQIETVRQIYQGPADRAGRSIFPGLARGSEAGWATLAGPEPLSLALETYRLLVYGAYGDDDGAALGDDDGALGGDDGDEPGWDYRGFDAETDIARAVQRIGPLMDSNDPDLSGFVEQGGRLLLYHGWNDPGIPPEGTIRYYDAVQEALGPARAADSVRLFLVPGMNHCGGGTGTDQFDAVAALDRWLETGAAPERIHAERRAGGELVRSRPLCPYPSVAVHDGAGDTDDAASFACR
jgi:hypothetical protein